MKFLVRSHYLRAVQACVAAKTDPRFYLHGWHLDPLTEDPRIVATDGHVLLTIPITVLEPADTAPAIFAPIPVPARKRPFEVIVDTVARTSDIPGQTLHLEAIDGRFPAWRDLVGKKEWQPGAVERIGIDPRMLAPIAKELDASCRMEFGKDARDMIKVTWLKNPDLICVTMPVRL